MTESSKTELFEYYEDLRIGVRFKVFEASVDFEAKEAVSFDRDGKPVDWGTGCDDMSENFDEGGRYVDGYIKWDKCCHYYFGDKNGYLHLCGEVEKFCTFMKRVTDRCGELLGGFYE
jgi:hypothetical protein